MLAWGAVLMLVGALSFVLPMFGRQFIVVSLLGLTGAGSAGAGLLFMAVGAYLFHLKGELAHLDRCLPEIDKERLELPDGGDHDDHDRYKAGREEQRNYKNDHLSCSIHGSGGYLNQLYL